MADVVNCTVEPPETDVPDATQAHLEQAYVRDLPLTLTRYTEPQLLGRRPVRYSEMLAWVSEQQRANRVQQQQQHGEPCESSSNAHGVGSSEGDSAAGELGVMAGTTRANRLPAELEAVLREAAAATAATPTAAVAAAVERVAAYLLSEPAAAQREQLLFGVRAVPAHSPEYLETLASWLAPLRNGSASVSEQGDAPAASSLSQSQMQRVEGLLAAGKLTPREERAGPGRAAAPLALTGSQWNPLVKGRPHEVLDAVVPPRLLLFYDIDAAAARVAHADAPAAADAVVGVALLMMECASTEQSSRAALVELEAELDSLLALSGARGWGSPLRSAGLVGATPAATETVIASSGGGGPAGTSTLTGTRGRAAPLALTSTLRPRPPSEAMATTLSRQRGGTASVLPAIRRRGGLHAELSNERSVVQFGVLSAELLRQVTLDLPERGVLLARVLNEAAAARASYELLVAGGVTAATQHRCAMDAEAATRAALRATPAGATGDRVAVLTREVDALRQQRDALQAKHSGLLAWARERRARDEQQHSQRQAFEDAVATRIRTYTETVKQQQDQQRRGSMVA